MSSLRRVLSALVGKQKSLAEGRRLRSAAGLRDSERQDMIPR
jgi:hypothetical protein